MYKVKNPLAPEHVCKIFFQQDKHYNLRSDFPNRNPNIILLSMEGTESDN